MIVYRRRIKFEEVDAAQIAFFAHFAAFAHEAMEHLFDALEGGYAALILARRVGFPAVHAETDFSSPVRYGDTLSIETTVAKLGTRSFVLRNRMRNEATGAIACELVLTVVTTDLVKLASCPMPDDVRALLEAHRELA